MSRWWREMREPKLKCERLGHKRKTYRREGIVKPGTFDFGVVALSVLEECSVCHRCGDHSGWNRIKERGISSLSMPISDMNKLDETGAVWTRNFEV